jgi:hypothetical protein
MISAWREAIMDGGEHHMRHTLIVFVLVSVFGVGASAAVLSNDRISCTITEDGIQSISVGGKIVTTRPSPGFPTHQGFYSLWNYHPDPHSASIGPVLHSTIASTPAAVTIADQCSNMAITYVYRLDGNDINFDAILKNNDSSPLTNISIALPTFSFGPGVTGNIKSWNSSYFVIYPQATFHPSVGSPLAVSFARDGNYGVALYCKSHFDKPTLFNAFQTAKGPGSVPPVADLTLYVQESVQPGAQLVVDVTIRVTTDIDLPTLLASYLRDFRAFAGPMRYRPDDRPWLQFAGIDSSFVTRQNPLGYQGDGRRLDLPSGIQRFEDMVWPSVGVTAGTIFWQPQGWNRRGCQYRPDFDVWPAAVSKTLPSLIKWYQSNGLKFGLCARPEEIVTPAGPDTDKTIRLDADNAAEMATLLGRFDTVTKLGVNAFYLDSFGTDINSYHIMKRIRAHLGKDIPTFSEDTSDLMLPYSGVYTELNLPAHGSSVRDGSVHWYDADTMAVFRLLYPHSTIITKGIDYGSGIPVPPARLARWKLTPLLSDFQARQYRGYLQDLITNYMTGNLWK